MSHDVLQWLGYLSPIGSVAAVVWGALRGWQALSTKVEHFGRQLERCCEQLDEFSDKVSNITERLARTEERVRVLGEIREDRNRSRYDF